MKFTFFKPSQERIDYFKKNSNVKDDYWDPAGRFNSYKIKDDCAKLRAEFEKLKNDPAKIKKNKNIFKNIRIIATFLSVGLFLISFIPQLLIIGIIVGWAPLFIYLGVLRSMSVDLVKLQIAEERDWAYDPSADYLRWKDLQSFFPKIFSKGNQGQNIEDQFWGKVNYKNKIYSFHAGLFTYTVRHGKNSTTYHTNYFAVKLHSKQKSSFYLYPENAFSKFRNLFSKKEINTESIEFNKTFAFSYKGKKDEHALNIVQALSPAVQQKLIDLKKLKGSLEILFQDDVFLVLFKGKLLHHLKTDFSKSLKVDKADVKLITDELSKVLDLSTEMLHYIK